MAPSGRKYHHQDPHHQSRSAQEQARLPNNEPCYFFLKKFKSCKVDKKCTCWTKIMGDACLNCKGEYRKVFEGYKPDRETDRTGLPAIHKCYFEEMRFKHDKCDGWTKIAGQACKICDESYDEVIKGFKFHN
ncbi:hypothetical protein L207DRAFT_535320 [Hyaloscypha variabilis F]|uniref:Uncharacterized protein n=1 Tax=Hyaloscypha variabilis (strain UAMH 11265 / GT02V1 / F) TaxID=1149755 RepID=A0A2J6R435_HYAVF|nr:hypothetical protein L207DRAFT_535320 [Hyaloscypha variabilis F]